MSVLSLPSGCSCSLRNLETPISLVESFCKHHGFAPEVLSALVDAGVSQGDAMMMMSAGVELLDDLLSLHAARLGQTHVKAFRRCGVVDVAEMISLSVSSGIDPHFWVSCSNVGIRDVADVLKLQQVMPNRNYVELLAEVRGDDVDRLCAAAVDVRESKVSPAKLRWLFDMQEVFPVELRDRLRAAHVVAEHATKLFGQDPDLASRFARLPAGEFTAAVRMIEELQVSDLDVARGMLTLLCDT